MYKKGGGGGLATNNMKTKQKKKTQQTQSTPKFCNCLIIQKMAGNILLWNWLVKSNGFERIIAWVREGIRCVWSSLY